MASWLVGLTSEWQLIFSAAGCPLIGQWRRDGRSKIGPIVHERASIGNLAVGHLYKRDRLPGRDSIEIGFLSLSLF